MMSTEKLWAECLTPTEGNETEQNYETETISEDSQDSVEGQKETGGE